MSEVAAKPIPARVPTRKPPLAGGFFMGILLL